MVDAGTMMLLALYPNDITVTFLMVTRARGWEKNQYQNALNTIESNVYFWEVALFFNRLPFTRSIHFCRLLATLY